MPGEKRGYNIVSLPETRISLGASTEGKRKLYWNNGDRICVNGATSDALANLPENSASADFTFSGTLEAPYSILYPASAWVDGSHISLPSGQTFTEGSFDPSAFPLAGYSTTLEGSPSLSHLASILHIAVKAAEGASVTLASVSFQGQDSEQVCGSFAIDYQTATLTGNSSDEACRKVTMSSTPSSTRTTIRTWSKASKRNSSSCLAPSTVISLG